MHTAAVHHKMSRYFQSYIANNICHNGDTIHIATIYRHAAISINRDASYFLGFRRISAFMDSHMWRTSNRFQIHGSNLSYIRNNCTSNCNKKVIHTMLCSWIKQSLFKFHTDALYDYYFCYEKQSILRKTSTSQIDESLTSNYQT